MVNNESTRMPVGLLFLPENEILPSILVGDNKRIWKFVTPLIKYDQLI